MSNLFSHAGYYIRHGLKPNTVDALKNAYTHGFRHIEFDIWWLESRLVLVHDQPKNISGLALFEEYLCYGNELKYWLDFKNLTATNCVAAFKFFKQKIDKSSIALPNLYFAPCSSNEEVVSKIYPEIKNIFGEKVNILAFCEQKSDLQQCANLIKKHELKFLSIKHDLVDQELIKSLPQIELFAWTVNDVSKVSELEKLGVRNFATDTVLPSF